MMDGRLGLTANGWRGTAVALVAMAALARLIPHPPNVAPIAAMALFGGAVIGRPLFAFGVPLLALALSDLVLNATLVGTPFAPPDPFVYGSFLLIGGARVRRAESALDRRPRPGQRGRLDPLFPSDELRGLGDDPSLPADTGGARSLLRRGSAVLLADAAGGSGLVRGAVRSLGSGRGYGFFRNRSSNAFRGSLITTFARLPVASRTPRAS